jgi:hypothetical protein
VVGVLSEPIYETADGLRQARLPELVAMFEREAASGSGSRSSRAIGA